MNQVRTVVITGASSGIGKATALDLASKQYRLVLAARGEAALQAVAIDCESKGAEVMAVVADVTNREDVERLASQALERFGHFDVWINNASVIYYGTFDDIPQEEFRKVVEVNLFGYVYGCQAALTYFKSQGRGAIINVASAYGAFPAPYASPYVASKFAVRGLSASIRQELRGDGHRNIHISTVFPATIDTPVYHQAANRTGKKVLPVPPIYPVSTAVQTITELIDNPRDEAVAGYAARGGMLLYQLSPWAAERILGWYVRRLGYEDSPEAPTSGNLFSPLSQGETSGRWPIWRPIAKKWVGFAFGIAALSGAAAYTLKLKKVRKE